MELVKQLIVIALLGGGFAGYYLMVDQAPLLRAGVVLMALLAAVLVGLTTQLGQQTWVFLKEARAEVRKVVWPTGKETGQTTLLVVVAVVIAGAVLWFFDWVLNNAVQALIGG
ncbi:MAG: preprotein translocase subunit SecE [Pseudomonadales bacterium]|nr:preprotein translocase subunit SecE [Pseudomonadales bacterium]